MMTTQADTNKKVFLQAPSFPDTKAFSALKALAKAPFDLTKEGAITKTRISSMKAKGAGYTFLYGFERVENEEMRLLEELAKERQVLPQMQAMQAGEITNFIEGFDSENRPVLHTAMRD